MEQNNTDNNIPDTKGTDTTNDTIDYSTQIEDPVNNTTDENDLPLPYPSVAQKVLRHVLEEIDKLTEKEFKRTYSNKDIEAIKVNNDSLNYTVSDNMLYEDANKEGVVNKPIYADKDLIMRPLNIRTNGGALNGDAAIAKIANIVGVGETAQIPLWHSGFWVTLKPVKDVELINLDIQLTNNQIKLGRETNTLIFSNYSVVFNRIVTNFIINHIQNTTLDLTTGEDILDYIAIQDLYTLVNALLYTMHPKGYALTRTCSNSININKETNKPMCDEVLNATIDFRKMLWVDRKSLSSDHLKQMSKRTPNSVTVDDVKEYQSTLPINKNKNLILDVNGTTLTFVLKSPMLRDYIDNGEKWVNDIITKSESIFTDAVDEDERDAIISTTAAAMVMGVYNIYVTNVMLEDGSSIENREDIEETLIMLSGDKDIITKFLNGVKDYINTNNISIIGIPNYTCPKCLASQVTDTSSKAFKEIIPINVLESFFDLCVFRIMKIRENNM